MFHSSHQRNIVNHWENVVINKQINVKFVSLTHRKTDGNNGMFGRLGIGNTFQIKYDDDISIKKVKINDFLNNGLVTYQS